MFNLRVHPYNLRKPLMLLYLKLKPLKITIISYISLAKITIGGGPTIELVMAKSKIC